MSCICCVAAITLQQILKSREQSVFTALSEESRRNIFKDAAAEVAHMVSCYFNNMNMISQPLRRLLSVLQLLRSPTHDQLEILRSS
jgi:hypothetical protein